MRVVIGYFEFEFVGGIFPKAGIGCDGDFEYGEVVGVGEVDVGYFSSVEFGNVCSVVGVSGWVSEYCLILVSL